ncbi:hypothetical protein SUGI_0984570 [Cryptomeria japonica]|nr:hypothetical protein SUGI_0984560 [Cryptomeria japonica]GLJ46705.1 hypothetical protein SUGI_0984570 [Cryptomeria japonica]
MHFIFLSLAAHLEHIAANLEILLMLSLGNVIAFERGASANLMKSHQAQGFLFKGDMKKDNAQESAQFVFEEGVAKRNSSSARTTLMIKNIPNVYSRDTFLEILDGHCKRCNEKSRDAEEPLSAYDFFYLPIDFGIKRNLGYAFVNFTSAKATWKLYKEFHMQPWKCLDSKRTSLKICEIIYAKVQGRAALETHFKKYNFRGVYAKYSLLVFDPPRNGKESRESSMSSERRGRLLYGRKC